MPVTDADIQDLDAYTGHQVRPATRRVYQFAWRGWEEWAKAKDETALPGRGIAFAVYLKELAETKSDLTGAFLSISSLKQAVSAVRWMHGQHNHPSPTDHAKVREVMATVKAQRPPEPEQSAPIDDAVIADIRRTACIPRQYPQRPESPATALKRGLRDIALASVASYAGLRVGEVARLRWEHVHEHPNGSAAVYVLPGKTKKSRTVFVPPHVVADLEQIRNGASDGDPVFCTRKGRGAPEKTLARWLKDAIARTGRDETEYSFHGCRVASGQRLQLNGAPGAVVNLHHGWESDTMRQYYAREIHAAEALRYMEPR